MDVTWWPDSSRLAFTSRVGDYPYYIGVVNADGSGLRELTTGWDPAWSPDGTRIAFARMAPDWETTQVFLMQADGTDIRQVSQGDSHKDTLGWTPDGQWITFWERTGYYHGVRPDGSGQHQLWDQGDVRARSGTLAWSPDGTRAAFIREEYVWSGDIIDYVINQAYVINADGSGLTNVTPPFQSAANEQLRGANGRNRAYVRPLWSPDGQFLAYEAYWYDGAIRVAYVAHPDWPHRTLAHGIDARWSPAP
jgi:TolB protein